MYPDTIDDRIDTAIWESRRLIEETKRLLKSSDIFVSRRSTFRLSEVAPVDRSRSFTAA